MVCEIRRHLSLPSPLFISMAMSIRTNPQPPLDLLPCLAFLYTFIRIPNHKCTTLDPPLLHHITQPKHQLHLIARKCLVPRPRRWLNLRHFLHPHIRRERYHVTLVYIRVQPLPPRFQSINGAGVELRVWEEAAESAGAGSRDELVSGCIVGGGGEGEFRRGVLGEMIVEEVVPGSFGSCG